jgi:hypothetical protein
MLVESHIEVADEFTLEFDPDLTRLPGDDVDPTRLVSDVPLHSLPRHRKLPILQRRDVWVVAVGEDNVDVSFPQGTQN